MEYIYDNLATYWDDVKMPGDYSWSHTKTLQRIDQYYNSKFEDGKDKDSRGYHKFFYNINKPACDIATKFVDLDTKDIILNHQLPDQEWKVWVMMHDLKGWLKKEKFGKLLNKFGVNYPKYGHIFAKKVKNRWREINIQNVRFDPASSSLETDTWFYELYELTARDIQSMGWNLEAVQQLLSQNKNKYLIYECYDYNSGPGKKWIRAFKGGLFRHKEAGNVRETTESQLGDRTQNFLPSLVLFQEEVDELPYRELKWDEVPGRRLGMGFVEYLFENQFAENQAENMERKGLYFTSLHIYQSRDSTIGRNIMTDMENGDIIRADDPLVPVQTEERNLPAFNATRNRWAINTVQKTFTTEVSRGENLPSRTPLGVANLQASMVASYFDLKRENFGMFVKELLEEMILEFKKDQRSAHKVILNAGAGGLEKFLRAISHLQVERMAVKYAEKFSGFFPSKDEMRREEERLLLELMNRKNVNLEIPEKEYDDIKYGLDIITTGEQVDVAALQQALQVFIQIVGSNPAVLQNRGTRTALFKSLELSGMSPIDLNLMEEAATSETQQQIPQGGSVGIPNQAQPRQGRIPQAV